MADEENEETEGEGEKKKGGMMMIIIIIVVVLILLIGIGVALIFILGGSSGSEDDLELEGEEGLEPVSFGAVSGAVIPLEPFIVNLQSKGTFLKTTIEIQFVDAQVPPFIENETPRIRDIIIRILSSRTSDELLDVEGKDAVKDEIVETLIEELGTDGIESLYFTEFIVQ